MEQQQLRVYLRAIDAASGREYFFDVRARTSSYEPPAAAAAGAPAPLVLDVGAGAGAAAAAARRRVRAAAGARNCDFSSPTSHNTPPSRGRNQVALRVWCTYLPSFYSSACSSTAE